MVNHVRTLLLNQPGDAVVPPWTIGEEYVPAEYQPPALSEELNSVRRQLFSSKPDRSLLNYRLGQFVPVLHLPELLPYTLAADVRFTYPMPGRELFLPATYAPTVVESELTIIGTPNSPDSAGRVHYDFTVTKGSLSVTVTDNQTGSAETQSVTIVNGLSAEHVPLGGTGYSCLLPDVSATWHVSVNLRPTSTVANMLELLNSCGEPSLLALFGAARPEPYWTFANLFYKHPEPAYRLGGALLALAARTDEARQ